MDKKVIIVVDDSSTIRRQVANALDATVYTIVEAQDGAEGLARLADHDDAALVICDVNMPTMDGLQMIARMHASGSRVPIVMLTNEAEPARVQEAKRCGAKGWILKPFKPVMLAAAVRKIVADATHVRPPENNT
jgi:two-component system chemotaxis response regulator CheY